MKNFKTVQDLYEYLTNLKESVEWPERLDNKALAEEFKDKSEEEIKELFLGSWRVETHTVVESDESTKMTLTLEMDNRPVIGNTINITFPELNSDNHEAKVDTGAEMCCLHAEQIKMSDDAKSVTFVFDGKKITMNCSGTVDIQTADHGIDKRPLVRLHVDCEHGKIPAVDFNLNDRSDMPHQILLGKAWLQAGNFLIDPLQDESTKE